MALENLPGLVCVRCMIFSVDVWGVKSAHEDKGS